MNVEYKQHRRGMLLGTEVIVAVVLIGMLAAVAAKALMDYHHLREQHVWRRAAGWAAAGQLQRVQAGAPLDSLPLPGVVPDEITLETHTEPGQGQWAEFSRVTVTATAAMPSGRSVREQVSGYVGGEVTP